MPPKKRVAQGDSAPAARGSKKSRVSSEKDGASTSAAAAAADPTPARSKRWAPVSGSANADADYKKLCGEMEDPYAYECLCTPPWPLVEGEDDSDDESDEDEDEDEDEEDEDEDDDEDKEDEEEDDDDEEEDDNKKKSKSKCDGGKTCVCSKTAAERPDHPWILMKASWIKLTRSRLCLFLRNPDMYHCYTYNDHASYGAVEVAQNLLLDFEETGAAGNWKEQWVICEAVVCLMHLELVDLISMIDDGELAEETFVLLGRMMLSLLARLERMNLLSNESEVRNLGLVMGLYIERAAYLRNCDMLEKDDSASSMVALGPAKDKRKWNPHAWDDQIAAYAKKYGIKLAPLPGIERIVAECDEEAMLPKPESNSAKGADPFKFAAELKLYKAERGVPAMMGPKRRGGCTIGGDQLDLTTWSSRDRKECAFDSGVDPIKPKQMKLIKEGKLPESLPF